jgi:CYTH domain-containing protein/predicted ATPase
MQSYRERIISLIDMFRFYPWIKVVAITGGPCGGKSTFLSMAIALLVKYNFKVIVIPEMAREFISAGVTPWDPAWKTSKDFQKHVFLAILEKEARYFQALHDMNLEGRQVVFLCDRGTVDGIAYVGEAPYKEMLSELGVSFADVLDRYDGVLHLVTAAKGAEKFYVNDEVRKETPEEARIIDEKTFAAWQKHQHHKFVDNSTDFPTKINRALLALRRILAMPDQAQEIEKKFRVRGFSPSVIPPGTPSYEITQVYLDRQDRPGIECRVRMKMTDGDCSYAYTEKTPTATAGVRGESEEKITESRFRELCTAYSHPNWKPIKKTRYKIRFDNYTMELDVYRGELAGLVIVEVEFPSVEEMNAFVPPPRFNLIDVTSDKRYSNKSLSVDGIP